MPDYNRRSAIAAGLGILVGLPAAAAPLNPDEGVTAPEDLMKEHGVLNRCLLIYEEGIRRIESKSDVAPEVFHATAALVKKFVEEYHEHNEETYIFPEFVKAKKLVDLVDTLKTQHRAGRRVTLDILRLSGPGTFHAGADRTPLVAACRAFIRMYRPHEAREDTILFPALRTILTAQQVTALGDRMEQDEHKVLGDEGFERSVDQVAAIEKQLGIYDLKQFTPVG